MKKHYGARINQQSFNRMLQSLWESGFNCNVVWCSPKIKKEFAYWSGFPKPHKPPKGSKNIKSIDVYDGEFGVQKIFSTDKVKFKQLKPKKNNCIY